MRNGAPGPAPYYPRAQMAGKCRRNALSSSGAHNKSFYFPLYLPPPCRSFGEFCALIASRGGSFLFRNVFVQGELAARG